MKMKKIQAMILGLGLMMLGSGAQVVAATYDHELTEKDMTFAWKVDGENLAVKISAKTEGWVGIGFNPSKAMKDSNIIIGYVKKGEVKILDEFGDKENAHSPDKKLGGTEDVTVVGGTEENGVTTLEFVIPLKTEDKHDTTIDPGGDTTVLLAYGGGRDSFRAKHRYRGTIVVNLTTGTKQ